LKKNARVASINLAWKLRAWLGFHFHEKRFWNDSRFKGVRDVLFDPTQSAIASITNPN